MSMRKRIFLIHMLMLIGGMAILFAVIFGSVRQGIRGYMDSGEWISSVRKAGEDGWILGSACR